MKNIRNIFLCFNTEFNKKNGHSESLELSMKHSTQNSKIIIKKEIKRLIDFEEFGNIVNDDIQ